MYRATNDALKAPVFRALNYVWTLLGLTAGEWMTAALPGLLYFAAAQLASAFAGEVPWQLFGVALLVPPALVLGGTPLVGLYLRPAVQALLSVAFAAPVVGGLCWLNGSAEGLPLWPAVPLTLGTAGLCVTLQWGQPPGALGRLFQGLWDAGRYTALAPDRSPRPQLRQAVRL